MQYTTEHTIEHAVENIAYHRFQRVDTLKSRLYKNLMTNLQSFVYISVNQYAYWQSAQALLKSQSGN